MHTYCSKGIVTAGRSNDMCKSGQQTAEHIKLELELEQKWRHKRIFLWLKFWSEWVSRLPACCLDSNNQQLLLPCTEPTTFSGSTTKNKYRGPFCFFKPILGGKHSHFDLPSLFLFNFISLESVYQLERGVAIIQSNGIGILHHYASY